MTSRSTKRLVAILAILSLGLPGAAWASSIGFQATRGQITSYGTVLNIKGSPITRMAQLPGPAVAGKLEWTSPTTGVLLSRNLADRATFPTGGSLTPGATHIPGAVIFRAGFVSPMMWSATFRPQADAGHGVWYYAPTGTTRGTLSDERTLRTKIRLAINDVPRGTQLSSLDNIEGGSEEVIVPEPSTLALLASGLTGVAMLVRRKARM